MDYDKNKVDDTVLALLYLNMFDDSAATRAWKSFNWDSMNRIHQNGFIADPKSKAKSVVVTEQGKKRAEELFKQFFAAPSQP